MDGLDCCYADINITKDYNLKFKIIDFKTVEFDKDINLLIKNTIGSSDDEILKICSDKLGIVFLKSVKNFLGKKKIDLISMHGQTIRHKSKFESIQIGNPKYLFNFYKKPVVYNFRQKDIILGGNGAPLVPYLDWLLFKNFNKKIIALNIGGIANVTLLPEKSNRDDIIGFDTGPGMCLIDRYVNMIWNQAYDFNGNLSKKGSVDTNILNYLMKDKYINNPFPKSTSTEYFDISFLKKLIRKFSKKNKYNILRTLVRYTAQSIFKNIDFFISHNDNYNLILSGGGTNNKVLVSDLEYLFDKKNVIKSITFNNIDENIKEGLLMAVMGYSRYNNLYNNMPSVTGASKYAVYGEIYE